MKDLYLVAIIGFLSGWLVLLPLHNIGIRISGSLIFFAVSGFTLLALSAFSMLRYLGKFWVILNYFSKFAAVGSFNALLNLGTLNLLMRATGISRGFYFTVFATIAFLVSATSSYLWNKFWTFGSTNPIFLKEYLHFVVFTIIGGIVNVSVASFLVNIVGAPAHIDLKTWANLAVVMATALSLMWNFFSYRYIVFSKSFVE